MFSALTQNSKIYMLDKTNIPTLKIGKILAVKPTQPFYTNMLDSSVTITADIEGNTVEFKQIPSNLSIANTGNVTISETQEAMCQEVENMFKVSKQIINSIPYHEKVIASCDGLLKELNPQFAREQAREEKIGLLENKVTGMENTLTDIKSMLVKALNN